MKKLIIPLFLVFLLSGCATMSAKHMRESQAANLTKVFNNSKEEVFKASKIALQQTDLIIRKENYEEGTIVATPQRGKAIGKRVFGALLSPLMATSYVGVHFYITPLENGATKLEIVQTYDNPLNPGRDYKTELMMKITEVMSLPKE